MTKPDPRIAGSVLTVIIRDDAPMIHCGDSPSYRSVRIELTDEQQSKLRLMPTAHSSGTWYHEQVSKCFIEEGT